MKKTICLILTLCLLTAGIAYAVPARDAEPKQTMEELHAKWDALTNRQKNGIYKLFNKRGRTEIELMNEYARLGLVTEAEARAFADRVASWLGALEQSGDLPPVYGYMAHGKAEPKPNAPEQTPAA